MERMKCPYCGEAIPVKAKKCRFCGEWLNQSVNTAATPSTPPSTTPGATATHAPAPPAAPQPVYVQVQQPLNQAPQRQEPIYDDEEEEEEEKYSSSQSFFKTYFIDSLIRQYANFTGLSSRSEFWLTYVAQTILSIGLFGLLLVLAVAAGDIGIVLSVIIASLVGLGLTVPGLAICCRRLKDAGFSPLFLLLSLVPGLGAIALLIMFALPSKSVHEPKDTSFGAIDWIITATAVLLMILGIWISVKSIDSMMESDYDFGGIEGVYREVPVPEDSISSQSDNTERSSGSYSQTRSAGSVDESLIDFVFSPDYVHNGNVTLEILEIGNNYERIFNETGSTHVPLRGTGELNDGRITVECFLTEDGQIHGRYHHQNGTNLDMNGYIRPDESLYIQLGHGSYKSDWYLYPVSDELSGTYRYEGTWGKNNKYTYIVFEEDM